MLKQYIDQLEKEWGESDALHALEDGSFTFTLSDELQISLRENPESGITLFTQLCPLPKERREEFLVMAMSANLLGRETGKSALGLDSSGKQVNMTCFLTEAMNYMQFRENLEDFANYADVWREDILAWKVDKNAD